MILLPAVMPEIPGPLGRQVIGGFDLSPQYDVKDSDSGGNPTENDLIHASVSAVDIRASGNEFR